ncbi:precorrin-4 C(11)-methyltransferase [Bacteroides helcogenes]|uniref:Precorrin-4 C11-methyltransferase n=1 Tax=Bacteroides helcogenes (strain ATCC 35417 / DSM 20613 / JCM 6297 / CCUG 15421 / P 36-108) TaxID=693979 RepID=E6SSV2_BACT6|nr:precorrin-4 C(11)-methyltransferase [Bacteroides helcogenes]ADV44183.1 precorrin-4 C11-methyltransferase [Bacteroides helcogenes P 36-108]MDY5238404.1 precorrin-4 C(11)-methyltransferase [Bacteroides helcogenes]
MKTAIILISEAGLDAAKLLRGELSESEIFTTLQEEGCTHIESAGSFVAENFNRYDALIFISAMGICVRAIAPCIKNKYTDPAVICVDSTGKYAVSVLSGHIGGANELTNRIASILGAEPVVTTQSDRTGLWALDTFPKRFDWFPVINADASALLMTVLAKTQEEKMKACMNEPISIFVARKPTALLITVRDKGTEWLESNLPSHVEVFYRLQDIKVSRFKLILCVSPQVPDSPEIPMICYIPRTIHIGIGLARQAGPTRKVQEAIWNTLKEHGIFPAAIASISTIDAKKGEPVVKALKKKFPIHFYTVDDLGKIEVPHPSKTVMKHMGTPSVSEAAALLSSGNNKLLVSKKKGENYTVAAALEINAERRGHIEIVGAGPGDPDLISVRGRQMLEKADLILYAGSLVPKELTLCAKPGATVRSSASMDLEEQFTLMKEFYDRGKFVVRLHTGDPCIYGAIQEQMNYFDQYNMSYHITPGISSFQAAAAALKSQFTIPEKVQSIILTRGEGRTPMPEREQLHLMARSQSTMCIFLSAGIAQQVQEELLQEYPENTPVAVCYHLTWKDERIFRGELKDLAKIIKENKLTLTTMIVVGEAIGNREGLSRLYAHEFKHLFRK